MDNAGKLSELETVQNPALGAFLLWHFGNSYQSENPHAWPVPLGFLLLPIVLHAPTLSTVISTHKSSGLALFAAKLGERQEELLAIHERALVLRQLSLESIGIGTQTSLLSLHYESATIASLPLSQKGPPTPERLRHLVSGSQKVGAWFSRLSLAQVAITLKVDF